MRKIYALIIGLLFISAGFGQTQTVTFTSTGLNSWTAPCGVTQVTVEVWGAGGAGGGVSSNGNFGGGGGAGGAYAFKIITVVPNMTYNITVGQGGQGGTGNGAQGNDSWFMSSSTVLAKGGAGGRANNGTGGVGTAVGSIGTTVYRGGAGWTGSNGSRSGSGGGGAGSTGNGGDAGNLSAGIGTTLGGGNGGLTIDNNNNGRNGGSYGGGGGGAHTISNSNWAGGDGGDGQVIITYSGGATYCAPAFGIYVEPITNVTFAGINNTTSPVVDATPELELFCNTATVVQGGTYPISVQGNTNDFLFFSYTNYFRLFVDWNQNGVLGDASNEIYNIGTITGSTGTDGKTATANIAVPAGAVFGTTKMRVVKNYGTNSTNGYGGSCANYNYGQAEDYIIDVTGNCTQPTGANANGAGTLTVCEGTSVTLKETGGTLGVGAQWKWYAGSCGGTLVNTNSNTNGDYTFTATPGNTTYYVRAEGGTCGTGGACKSVVVNVNAIGTIALTTGPSDFSACKGTNTTYSIFTIGGGATGISATGLPSGMSVALVSGKQYTITGNPTAAIGTYNYTLTPNGNGPCVNSGISGVITVSQVPLSISYTSPVVYCSGAMITPNNPVMTGGNPTNYSISPALPAGLSIDATTGIISGTPSILSPATVYTITGTNGCGSKNGTVNIAVSNGDMVYNVTPNTMQTVCSTFGGTVIGLSGSEIGVKYQLYLTGVATGASVDGTGAAISFGSQSAGGTYTVKTTSSCATNMNGSTIINVTPASTTDFSYSLTNCKVGTTSPTLTGSPQTGTFSAAGGLVFTNNSTGLIDLAASTPGTYAISYTVPASGGCPAYTVTHGGFVVGLTPVAHNVFGGGGYCAGDPGVEVGVDNSQMGVNYQLYNGATPVGAPITGTGTILTFGNQTAGTYTVIATSVSSPNCQTTMNGNAVVTLNPSPPAITVTPSSLTLCQGAIISLSASGLPPASSNANVSFSNTTAVAIPDNDPLGASSLIKVTGIPVGATITSVWVTFNISHTYDGDLLINLKGPNGNVLNLANGIGASRNGFVNTRIQSDATNTITSATSTTYNGIYLPQAENGVIGASIVTSNVSNSGVFSQLYGSTATSANGNWTFSVRDKGNFDVGSISNWSIRINYSVPSNPVDVTWSPVSDLYTDPGATIPYIANTAIATVYAKPSTFSPPSFTYTATASTSLGCTTSANSVLTVNQSPQLTLMADYCSNPGKVTVTATSDIAVNSWVWSTGGAGTGTGNFTRSIAPNTAGTYYVSVKSISNSCPATGSLSVAQELVTNGDFEAGNVGFTSGYNYVDTLVQNGLYPEFTYSVYSNPNFMHDNFWGTDHTTANGEGKFMLVNGTGGPIVWKETVTVLPNTDYYFSAYAVSLNNVSPFANLRFQVNTTQVGTSTGALPSKTSDNNAGTWKRFYGIWNSGAATTAVIEIVDLQGAPVGNDFGLDDISFGTLSTFLNLTSATGTDGQTVCANAPITTISYEVGGDGSVPTVTGLPPGISTYWNGRDMVISGTPVAGTYGIIPYTITAQVCAGAFLTKNGTITLLQPSKAGDFTAPILSTCYNASKTISLSNKVGNILKWEKSTDSLNFTDVLPNNTTVNLNTGNLTSAMYYRAIARNGTGCMTDTSIIVKVGVSNLWTGNIDTDWNTAANWSDNTLPSTNCSEVYVPNTANQPILSNAPVSTITNLHILANAQVTISSTGVMQVGGTISNLGIFDVTDGAVEYNGAAPQTIGAGLFYTNKIKDLIISNNVTLAAAAQDSVTGHLSFGSTGKTLTTSGNLTLQSSINGTASVGQMMSGNKISGDVIVERYIATGTGAAPNHGKSWQLLAVPTTGATLYSGQTIKQSWGENATASNVASPAAGSAGNLIKGYGTMLTSDRPNAVALGFDAYTSPGPSIKTYNQVTQQYDGPASTSTALYNPNGYFILVRGDRSVNAFNQAATPTILRSKGKLFDGTYVPPMTNLVTDGILSVGNPYASPIDFSLASKTGLVDGYQLWDPRLGGGYNLGAFQTIVKDPLTGNYRITPGGGSYGPAGPITNFIQSGQAFFVQTAIGMTGSISFTEGVKANIGSVLITAPARAPQLEVSLRTSIYSVNGVPELLDGVLNQFDNSFSNAIDQWDARKNSNTGENLSIKTAGRLLVVERSQPVSESDTIFLNLTGVRAQTYRFSFDASNLNMNGVQGFLEDTYQHLRTPLNMNGNTAVDFAISNAAASYAANRFRIVFAPAAALPVTFTNIKAYRQDQSINVEWDVDNEMNIANYTVEKSADGSRFTPIAVTAATGNGGNSVNYGISDASPYTGNNYYRIRSNDVNGKQAYTKVVKVFMGTLKQDIQIYPNPITDGMIHLQFMNEPGGKYGIRLLNKIGQVILSKAITRTDGSNTELIKWDFNLAHGMYQLEITKPDGSVKNINVLY